MNKKFIAFIILIFLILIIGFIFGILTLYRFSIVQDILRKTNDNIKKDNYHMITTITNEDGSVSTTEAFYREDVGKLIAENGVYTWVDGEYAYLIDEEKKEAYVLNINNENIGLVSYEMFATIIPGYKNDLIQKLLISGNLRNTIKKTKVDNIDCFIIKIHNDNYTKTVWISTISATPFKAVIEFSNGTKMNYDYNIIFNETRLKDIELPKIDDYTVINTENNEVIKENSNIKEQSSN